jgi:hypothetical protein
LILVFGQDELVAQYVLGNLGLPLVPPYTAIGGTRDGQTLCIGAVFNQYNGSNIEITLYGPGALTRGAIRGVYHYAFDQLRVNRVSAKTRRSNKNMQRLLPRFGFKFEGISARYFGPEKADDAIRFVLFPDDARKWING